MYTLWWLQFCLVDSVVSYSKVFKKELGNQKILLQNDHSHDTMFIITSFLNICITKMWNFYLKFLFKLQMICDIFLTVLNTYRDLYRHKMYIFVKAGKISLFHPFLGSCTLLILYLNGEKKNPTLNNIQKISNHWMRGKRASFISFVVVYEILLTTE